MSFVKLREYDPIGTAKSTWQLPASCIPWRH